MKKISKYDKKYESEFFIFKSNSTPSEPIWRTAWELALQDQKCGSSPYVCIEHFNPSDYDCWQQGRIIHLKKNAVPSCFNEFMEVEECLDFFEKLDNVTVLEDSLIEVNSLKLEKEKLIEKINQMESKFQSEKIIFNTRAKMSKGLAQKQAAKIRSLQKELDLAKQETTRLHENNIFAADKVITFSSFLINKHFVGNFSNIVLVNII